MRTIFTNAKIVTPYRIINHGSLLVEAEKIAGIEQGNAFQARESDRTIDAKGLYLAPGFIDIHTHGAGNADFLDGSLDAVLQACSTHMKHGTTSIMPSTLSCPEEELFANLDNIVEASKITEGMPEIIGIHLEGPYFSPRQNAAQDARFIKYPNPAEYEALYERCSFIKRWSVAPELPGALEMGRWLRKNDIIASIGHSDAVYDEVVLALENGYSMVTHLFNGMSRLTRRNADMYLGVAESALVLDDLYVEIIADGKHLPASLLNLIYKTKGADRICLVTDSMRAAGMDVKESILGSIKSGQRVEIEDGVAYMPSRESFGGSVATADRLIRVMHRVVGVPLIESVKMMTLVPARILKIDGRKGSLEVEKEADIILFDENIDIKLVMAKGNVLLNT